MRVTKEMLDGELQPAYGPLGIVSSLLTRKWGIRAFNFIGRFSKGKNIEGIDCKERFIPSKSGGPSIRLRIFRPLNHEGKLPSMLYLHSGGFVVGNPEQSLEIIKKFIEKRPCVVIAPDYRKALKDPFPAGFNDCYESLLWAKENAEDLEILSDRFMVAGHSGGGGLTAAVTLKARDTQDVDVAFQMPIYPMIDDRQLTESAKDIEAHVWNTKTNALAWNLYLRNLKKADKPITSYAAPARNMDYSEFPPTITFVGEYEPFRDETIEYVDALTAANIPVKFKFYERCFHGFDSLGGEAQISNDAVAFTYDSYAEYYDKYVKVKE